MNKGGYLRTLLRSSKTVFSFEDIALLWSDPGTNAARVRLNYYLKNGELYRIRRGLYSKDKNYDRWEVATRICTPSYISFETVLASAGITFQYYSRIFVATYLAREIDCDGQTYQFRKLKDVILTHPAGVQHDGRRSIATPERAFLDTMYLHTTYYFDNLLSLDWEAVNELLPVYGERRMAKQVDVLYKHFKSEQ